MSPVVPLLALWLGGVVAFFLDGRKRAVATFALLVAAGSTAAAGWLLGSVIIEGPRQIVTGGWPAGIGIRLRADTVSALFAVVSLFSITCGLGFELARGIASRALPALLLLLAAGLTGLYLTADVFNFYVFFEVAMVASFALAAYGEGAAEVRAALVFAFVNLVGSAFFLTAIAALYRMTGTLDMRAIADALAGSEASLLVGTLLFVALGLKLGFFPLHFWLPAVYRGTRPVVAAVLSGAVIGIGNYGLLRFGVELFPSAVAAGRPVLIGIGTATIIYGGLLAASRRLPAEVLAYSAIGQAGYVLVALAVGGLAGLTAAIVFATVNSLNKTMLFLTSDVGGPVAGAAFAIGAFSVVGIPPTAGFVGKVELFRMAIAEGNAWLIALLITGSLLTLIYMLQAYHHTYLRDAGRHARSPSRGRLAVAGLAGLIIAAGLWAEPIVAVGRSAAMALLGVS